MGSFRRLFGMNARKEVREAEIMLSNNRPLKEVIDRIWSGCNFEWSNPRFVPESLPIAFVLYDRCKASEDKEELGQCMLLLGRIFNAKKDYLPADSFSAPEKRLKAVLESSQWNFFVMN